MPVDRTTNQKRQRKIRSDSDSNKDAAPVAYVDESARPREWSGIEQGPYVVINNEATESGNTFPQAQKGVRVELLTQGPLSGGGAFQTTDRIDLGTSRRLLLEVRYLAAAAGGYPAIIPVASNADTIPAITDDVWVVPTIWDGIVTGATVGTLPAGPTFTNQPDFGRVVHRQIDLNVEPADAANDIIRAGIPLNIEDYRWMYFLVAEEGATGGPGSLSLAYALSS